MLTDTFNKAAMAAELLRDEGKRNKVYDDGNGRPIAKGSVVQGNPTIGIGRNLAARGLSEDEIGYLLGNDIDYFAGLLDADPMWSWWRTLDSVRQRALLNMAFNMGQHTLDQFVLFNKYCKAHDWTNAAASLVQSAWWHQVGARATRIQHMILTGLVPDGEV